MPQVLLLSHYSLSLRASLALIPLLAPPLLAINKLMRLLLLSLLQCLVPPLPPWSQFPSFRQLLLAQLLALLSESLALQSEPLALPPESLVLPAEPPTLLPEEQLGARQPLAGTETESPHVSAGAQK